MRKVIQRSTMCKFLHDAGQRDYVVILKLWHIKLVHRFRTFFQKCKLPTDRAAPKGKSAGPPAYA